MKEKRYAISLRSRTFVLGIHYPLYNFLIHDLYKFHQQVRIIRTFKIEKKLVSKSVAKRKALPKFGMSRNDRPGKRNDCLLINIVAFRK